MKTPGDGRKGAGIDLVLSNESAAWKQQFLSCAANVLRRNPYATGEDVRMFMTCMGLPKPHHENTWGAMWNAVCKKDGWVEKTHMSRNLIFPDSHSRSSRIWKSLMYIGPDAPLVEVFEQ